MSCRPPMPSRSDLSKRSATSTCPSVNQPLGFSTTLSNFAVSSMPSTISHVHVLSSSWSRRSVKSTNAFLSGVLPFPFSLFWVSSFPIVIFDASSRMSAPTPNRFFSRFCQLLTVIFLPETSHISALSFFSCAETKSYPLREACSPQADIVLHMLTHL